MLINWINTIKQPRCLLLSNVHDLKDGKVFFEILKQLLLRHGMPLNAIISDENLLPEERLKLVLYSLFELLEGDGKQKVGVFYNQRSFKASDNNYYIELGLLLKDLTEKGIQITNERKEFIHNKWREIETESNQSKVDEDNKENMRHYNVIKSNRTRNKESKCISLKSNRNDKNKRFMMFYDGNTFQKEQKDIEIDNKDNKGNNSKELIRIVSCSSFFISNASEKIQQLCDLNHSKIKTPTKGGISSCRNVSNMNMLFGLQNIMNPVSQGNKSNEQDKNEDKLEYYSFFYPSNPIIEPSTKKYKKYKPTNICSTSITITNDSVANSLMNIIQSNAASSQNNNKQVIYKWLSNLVSNIKDISEVIIKTKQGSLLCDIINHCESKKDTIKTIIQTPISQKDIYHNINQALIHYKSIKLHSSKTWTVNGIIKGDDDFIWQLLNIIYLHYCNTKSNQSLGTLLLNDSSTSDNMQNCNNNNPPISQISDISNIPKTNNLASMNHSNNNTLTQCLLVNSPPTIRLNSARKYMSNSQSVANILCSNSSNRLMKKMESVNKPISVSKLPLSSSNRNSQLYTNLYKTQHLYKNYIKEQSQHNEKIIQQNQSNWYRYQQQQKQLKKNKEKKVPNCYLTFQNENIRHLKSQMSKVSIGQ